MHPVRGAIAGLLLLAACTGTQPQAGPSASPSILATETGSPATERWVGDLIEDYSHGVTGGIEVEISLEVDSEGRVVGGGSGEGVIDGTQFSTTIRIRGVRDEGAFRLRISSTASNRTITLTAPINGEVARGDYREPAAHVTVTLGCENC